jgi:membrane protease YdiL (CAAX protease family)
MASDWYIWLLADVPLNLFAFPVFLLVLPKPRALPAAESRLGAKEFFTYFAMCYGVAFIGNLTGLLVMRSLESATSQLFTNPLMSTLSMSNVYINFLFAVLLAPVMEELIFRKLLIDRMAGIDKPTAVFFSALAFGLFHGNFYQFFYAFGVGLLFGIVYVRTGRLRYSIALHMSINFLSSVATSLLFSRMSPDAFSGSYDDIMGNIAALMSSMPVYIAILAYSQALMAIAGLGVYFLIKNRKKLSMADEKGIIPTGKAFPTVFLTWGVELYIALSGVVFVVNLFRLA